MRELFPPLLVSGCFVLSEVKHSSLLTACVFWVVFLNVLETHNQSIVIPCAQINNIVPSVSYTNNYNINNNINNNTNTKALPHSRRSHYNNTNTKTDIHTYNHTHSSEIVQSRTCMSNYETTQSISIIQFTLTKQWNHLDCLWRPKHW